MSEATETPASLRALAEHLESKPTEYEHGKAAELRARAAEMEREPARPQPQTAGKPSAGPWAYDEADGNIYAPDGAPESGDHALRKDHRRACERARAILAKGGK